MEVDRKRRLAAMAAALSCDEDESCGSKRSLWMKDWMCRKERGMQNQLYEELLDSDPEEYRRLLRVSREQFLQLLSRVGPRIARQDTVMRRAIPPETRLQVTLRYLATGESHHSLSRQFRLGHSSVNDLIHETCTALYEELKEDFIRTPKTEEEWLDVISGFAQKWQFPNCAGALDGKHVCIWKPPNSGSVYFNYKKTHSIILFAVVDANCKFIYTDVGAPGSQGDAGIWQTTPLQRALASKKIHLPELVKVASSPDKFLPPVFVGDDAFPIGKNLMKPFGGTKLTEEQRIFNYRLSRARRVVENTFGILANRFRCLLTVINAIPERATAIVNAACVLHNFLSNDVLPQQPSRADAENERRGRPTFFSFPASRGRASTFGAAVREDMCGFFNGRGAVSWQREAAYVELDKHCTRRPKKGVQTKRSK
ncbi:uncharacterized protein ISCGN_006618 [Ixodes scapularis]